MEQLIATKFPWGKARGDESRVTGQRVSCVENKCRLQHVYGKVGLKFIVYM